MTANVLNFYLNLKTGSITAASKLSYFDRFKSGNFAYVGKLQCNQNRFYSKKVCGKTYDIFRNIYKKEFFIKTVTQANCINK